MNASKPTRACAVISFLLMIFANIFAEVFALNGTTTGGVSDSFPTLFTPAGYTFAIWGLIYLLLLLHVLYVTSIIRVGPSAISVADANYIERLFSVSSIANAAWIICWHFFAIPLTVVLIFTMLACIALVNVRLHRLDLGNGDRVCTLLPFSVYFGWLTVAAIANVCVLLVSWGFTGAPFPDIWTIAILLVGSAIASATALHHGDAAYMIVVIWAYIGILVNHVSAEGYALGFVDITVTTALCIAAMVTVAAVVLRPKGRPSIRR